MTSLRALVSVTLLAGCLQTPWIGTPATVASTDRGYITAIAADDDYVYWLAAHRPGIGLAPRADGVLWFMPRAGGTPMTLASGLADPQNLVLLERNVYFTTWGPTELNGSRTRGGALLRVSKEGRDPGVIANDQDELTGLVADDTGLYCIAGGQRILGLVKAGGQPKVLVANLTAARDLVRDDARLYFVSDSSIWSVPKDGGSPPTLVTGSTGLIRSEWVESLAADRETLYWLGRSNVRVLRKQAKSGGPIEEVPWPSSSSSLGPGRLLANERLLIYQPFPGYLGERALVGIRKEGGPPLLQIPEPVSSVHADARELYWGNGPALKRMPFPGLPAN
jgi:hypothetical protein